MKLRVVHLLKHLTPYSSGEAEIAAHLNSFEDIDAKVISFERAPRVPDTANEHFVAINGVKDTQEILDYVNQNRVDIVHTHHNAFASESRSAFLKLGRSGALRIDSQQGRIHYPMNRQINNLSSLFFSDGLTYISHTAADVYHPLERILIGWKPQSVIHLGVNTKNIAQYRRPAGGQIRHLSVAARMIPRKNYATLFRALKLLGGGEYHLHVIGSSKRLSQVKQFVSDESLGDDVTFYGELPDRKEVYRILASTDLFVLPSLAESFCTAVVEAMALGLPVVASDLPIFYEVLGSRETLVPATDAGALAEKIKTLRQHPEQAMSLGHHNRIRAETYFDLEETIKKFRDFYWRLIHLKRSGRSSHNHTTALSTGSLQNTLQS